MEQVQILEFGPFRAAGLAYRGKNESSEIPQLWDRLVPHIHELAEPETGFFGICRCIPGVKDGTFEYIAAMQPRAGAVLPEGFVEVEIPRGVYAVYGAEGLEKVKETWMEAGRKTGELKEWVGYCGAEGCECATHPGFEYYRPGYPGCGRLEILLPVRRKS